MAIRKTQTFILLAHDTFVDLIVTGMEWHRILEAVGTYFNDVVDETDTGEVSDAGDPIIKQVIRGVPDGFALFASPAPKKDAGPVGVFGGIVGVSSGGDMKMSGSLIAKNILKELLPDINL